MAYSIKNFKDQFAVADKAIDAKLIARKGSDNAEDVTTLKATFAAEVSALDGRDVSDDYRYAAEALITSTNTALAAL